MSCAGVKRVLWRFGLTIDNGDDEEISNLLDADDRRVSSWEDDDEVLVVVGGEKRLLPSIDDNEWHDRRTHKKKKKERSKEVFPTYLYMYTNFFFTLIKIDFLTLLFLFFIRLIINTITVYIEDIHIKLIILFSSLTQLIKSVFDKE